MRSADEMSTEVMENAANAATKRREVRRRRILMDPEERMRKLTGYSSSNQEPVQPSYNTSGTLNGLDPEPDLYNRMSPTEDFTSQVVDNRFIPTTAPVFQQQPQQYENQPRYRPQPQTQQQLPSAFGTAPDFASLFQTPTNLNNLQATTGTQQSATVSATGKPIPSKAFVRGRRFIYFILGILVRVALIYSVGRRFVQSIINPFVFAEVAVIGYQRAVGMDLGSGVTGGLWLSALVLSGIRPDIIDSYKTIMGIVTAILDDFTLYFFAFVAVHLVCLPFA